MKIIIVGGAGFIGISLVEAFLKKNLKIVVVDTQKRLKRNKDHLKKIETYSMEYPHIDRKLLDNLFSNKDILIHLAYTTNPSKSMQDIRFDADTNIGPSIDLFSIAVKNNLQKIIFSSSGGTVYGNVDTIPIKETDGRLPISAYGVSKIAIENYLALLTHNTNTEGISLRIGNPYGSYQFNKGTTIGAIAIFLNAVKNKVPINIWGDGNNIRDYIYIDNLSEAFFNAITIKNLEGCYNIGSGKGYSVNEIIKVIQKVTDISPSVVYHKTRQFDVRTIILDSTKFQQATNWKAKVNFEESIRILWEKLN